jgi:hypothetical protein
MTTTSNELEESCWVLVEGPNLGDPKFTSQWLLAAVKADGLLQNYYREDPTFRPSIERLEFAYVMEFSDAAMAFLAMCLEHGIFSLNLADSDWAEPFAIMAATGFFTATGERYQVTLPKELTIQTIRSALLRLIATEDLQGTFELHPECLLTTRTEWEAGDCTVNHRGWGALDRAILVE